MCRHGSKQMRSDSDWKENIATTTAQNSSRHAKLSYFANMCNDSTVVNMGYYNTTCGLQYFISQHLITATASIMGIQSYHFMTFSHACMQTAHQIHNEGLAYQGSDELGKSLLCFKKLLYYYYSEKKCKMVLCSVVWHGLLAGFVELTEHISQPYTRHLWFCVFVLRIWPSCRCSRKLSMVEGRLSKWFKSVKKGVLKLFLSISMAYNAISCRKVDEILKVAKFAI